MALVGDHDDRSAQVLIALGKVVHGVHQADVADGHLCLIAFTSVSGEIDNGHIALGPRRAFAIEQFTLETLAKQVDGLAHFLGTLTTLLRQVRVSGDVQQGVAHVAGQYLATRRDTGLRRIENALADQAAIGSTQARLFLGLATGDHQASGDFQFAENIALVFATGYRLIVQLIDRQTRHLIRLLDQAPSIGERGETDRGARFQLDLVDRQALCREVVALQTE
ncbi:hypothetical protein D3C71_1263160 [compost metagenome]